MPKFWRRTSTTTLFSHPRLTVVEDEVVLPTSQKTKYLRFTNASDFVTVIPINKERQICLLREYSYPLDDFLYQFPEGAVEEKEKVIEAARRELNEEAGLRSTSLRVAGKAASNHRREDAWQHVVTASNAKAIEADDKLVGDPEEHGLTTKWLSEEEIQEMIRDGKIVQRNTLTAWAIYRAVQQM